MIFGVSVTPDTKRAFIKISFGENQANGEWWEDEEASNSKEYISSNNKSNCTGFFPVNFLEFLADVSKCAISNIVVWVEVVSSFWISIRSEVSNLIHASIEEFPLIR